MTDNTTPETGLISHSNGPRCAECGSFMYHSRLHGYCCARNPKHEGIVRDDPVLPKPTSVKLYRRGKG